ncbi:MAG TPA: acetyl/propionyl/methylcrotonyl-CoA carboxylase subunit alpha [Pseudoxanthomonas sp.]|nr:acetyl/propionyl/methylcrotonyl-CoA carboxylase subunit alpha [Pseudoxanthomonas sp.]
MFEKILIANRGEIACRIIRSCRRLGIRTVAVYSEADAGAQHVRQADEAYPIGGPRPAESYLRGDAILEVAQRSGAQAIHPGYGFLSENADFADAVEAAGLAFIGPGAACISSLAPALLPILRIEAAGVPVVPGYTGEDQSLNTLSREAARIGFPLMIKAAHGGGGKGMRIVHRLDDFAAQLESCQREAANAFGKDRVLLERYIGSPRHIEIQVFADRHGNTLHLNERECSAQRRYQKVLEEAPSPFLTPALRQAMGDAAVQAARAIDYVNAGTVEFIVAPDGTFYFMEINTRLQVEHPVTEMTTGLDLVEWQLRVAAGEPMPLAQAEIAQRGHAIEVRLYAEDPEAGFLPGSGKLEQLDLPPADQHVRIDAGVVAGDTVSIFYDPMIAKLIVWDLDRPRALARLRDALRQCDVVGPKSNIAFLERLARHPAVVEGTIDTGYLDRHLEEFTGVSEPDALVVIAAATAQLLAQEAQARANARASADPGSPWALADGWRLGHAGRQPLVFLFREQTLTVQAQGHDGDYRIDYDGRRHQIHQAQLTGDTLSLRIDQQARRFQVRPQGSRLSVHDGQQRWSLAPVAAYRRAASADAGSDDRVRAPMPGRVVVVKAKVGDSVSAGQELLVMEAMKMELALKAPRAGVVKETRASSGDFVDADSVLVTLE